MTLSRKYFSALAIAVLSTAAQAAPEDDYVTYRTATAINHACGGLKFLEHIRVLGAAQSALGNTTEYRLSGDGRMPEEEFEAWLAALDAKVEAQADAVGCTQEAMQFIMRGKDVASRQLYKGLVLANYFAGTPPTDIMVHVKVEPDRMKAMLAYDAYLQALYRENFAAFSAQQKELATRELPVLNPFGGSSDFSMGGLATALISPEDASKLSNAQFLAAYELDAVFFEVAAESAGFVVRPRLLQDTWTIPELRSAAAPAEPGFVVVDGPGYDLVDFDLNDGDSSRTKLFRVVTLKPDNGLRVMFYGDAAARVVGGTVRLYVMDAPLPGGTSAHTLFNSAGFRDLTTGYAGVPIGSGCLAVACFDFSADATDAFVANKDNEYAELVVSAAADAQPVESENVISRPGRVSNFYAYKLLKE